MQSPLQPRVFDSLWKITCPFLCMCSNILNLLVHMDLNQNFPDESLCELGVYIKLTTLAINLHDIHSLVLQSCYFQNPIHCLHIANIRRSKASCIKIHILWFSSRSAGMVKCVNLTSWIEFMNGRLKTPIVVRNHRQNITLTRLLLHSLPIVLEKDPSYSILRSMLSV